MLYSYLDQTGIALLLQGAVRCFTPTELDDPWLEIPQQGPASFESLLEQQYQQLPDHMRELMDFDFFCQQAENKRSQIEQQLSQQQDQQIHAPVIRLFEQPNNLLLWQLYAQNHQGMVIGFDHAEYWPDALTLNQINYSRHHPGWPQQLFTQPQEMAALKEWRLQLKPGASQLHNMSGQQTRSSALPLSHINSLFFGCHMPSDVIRHIITSLTALEIDSLRLFRCQQQPGGYGIVPNKDLKL